MTRRGIANLAVAVALVGVVGIVLYLETTRDAGGAVAPADPSRSAVTDATDEATSAESTEPLVTEPPTTEPTATEPTATEPPTTAPPTTAAPTTAPPTTIPPTTTTVAPPPQQFVPVVVANGSVTGERNGLVLFRLFELGYENSRTLNGSLPLPETTVFYQPDWLPAAERLATELGLAPTAVAPIETAPPVAGIDGALLMVYLGGT